MATETDVRSYTALNCNILNMLSKSLKVLSSRVVGRIVKYMMVM